MTGPQKHTIQTPFTSGGMPGRLGLFDDVCVNAMDPCGS